MTAARGQQASQDVGAQIGDPIWTSRYNREMKDVFAIQEEIAQAIAQRLKIMFPWRGKSLVKIATPNLEAYQSYLKGQALLYKRGSAIRRALACCRREKLRWDNFGTVRS